MQPTLANSTNLAQNQTLTPQAYHALHILQMNLIDLEQHLNNVINENPLLELPENISDVSIESLDYYGSNTTFSSESNDTSFSVLETLAQKEQDTLTDHLYSQFDSSLEETDRQLLLQLIAHLDHRGYLSISAKDFQRQSGYPIELVEYSIKYLQTLDSLGIGAKDLPECLWIQLKVKGFQDSALKQLLNNHLEDLSLGYYNKISQSIGVNVGLIRLWGDEIKTLNPKPAASYGSDFKAIIIPEIFVTVEDGKLSVFLAGEKYSGLKINESYVQMMNISKDAKVASYLQNKRTHAQWIIDAIQNRRQTILNVAQYIVSYQQDFFAMQNPYLKPLMQKQLAEVLAICEGDNIITQIGGNFSYHTLLILYLCDLSSE